MKLVKLSVCAMVLAAGGLGDACAQAQQADPQHRLHDHDGRIPKSVSDLVLVRPFTVKKPMSFVVGGKTRKVTEGYVLVIKAHLGLLEPRNAPDYLLFVGDAVGQKVNSGYKDGHVIVITPKLDLSKAPLWFGSREIPNRLTPSRVAFERKAAERVGVRPFDKKVVEKARQRGGERLLAADLNELWYETVPLILEYAPAEKEMAKSMRK